MLLGALGVRLLSNILTGKGTIRAGEGTVRAGKNFNAASSFKNFELQKYYQNEPKFNGVYSRNNLSKMKDATYAINLLGLNQ